MLGTLGGNLLATTPAQAHVKWFAPYVVGSAPAPVTNTLVNGWFWLGIVLVLDPFDRTAYKRRNLIERAFCRIKDFRRVATRYDNLVATYAAAISLAALVTWWL